MNTALVNNPEFNAFVMSRTPAGRWGDVDELKGVAVFLAAPASDFVNGQILYVDGGVLAAM
jgi:gluconate 5-dehydrogenase